MENHNHEIENEANVAWGVLTGLLIGGLAGAGTMLLLAPQSGKKTRAKIQQKSIELSDQAAEVIDDAVTQVGVKARQIRTGVRKQTKRLDKRGHMIYDEQKEHLSSLVKAGENAVQSIHA